jgi:hypothetical protein
MTEVSVGIVVANLPPLRKSFDGLLKHMLSHSSASRSTLSRFQSFHLPTYHTQRDPRPTTSEYMPGRGARKHSMTTITGDHECGKAILEHVSPRKDEDSHDIMCTTYISVENSR